MGVCSVSESMNTWWKLRRKEVFQKQPRNSIFPSRRSAVRLKRLRKSYMGSRFLTGMWTRWHWPRRGSIIWKKRGRYTSSAMRWSSILQSWRVSVPVWLTSEAPDISVRIFFRRWSGAIADWIQSAGSTWRRRIFQGWMRGLEPGSLISRWMSRHSTRRC